jgi:hypothetical protein
MLSVDEEEALSRESAFEKELIKVAASLDVIETKNGNFV